MSTQVPLSIRGSFPRLTPISPCGLCGGGHRDTCPTLRRSFVAEILALPRRSGRGRVRGGDFASAVAWVAGVAPTDAAAVMARYPVDCDETRVDAITPQILESLYEAVGWEAGASPFATRKIQGSFHTPVEIVDAMLADALRAFLAEQTDVRAALEGLRIVDPSVGPGAFLAGALRAVRAVRVEAGLSPEVPARALCGVDVSPLAVQVCQFRLALAGYPMADLRVGDSLVDGPRFRWDKAFPGGFDLVVGNPPYLRDRHRKNLDGAALKHAFRAATSHYDLYVLFMERALQVARDRGVVCLITSNRWLAQKYGRGIRGVLVEHRLHGIVDLRFRAFGDAAVQSSITLVQKQPAPAGARTVLAVADTIEEVGSLLDPARPAVAQCQLDARPFRFELESADHDLVARVGACGVKLEELAFVTLGMVFHDPRPNGRRKADYLRETRRGRFTRRLLDGEHVQRWEADGGLWLDYQPGEHREPRFPELFAATKVLCRRILGRGSITAMVDEDGRWFSDNVVGVVPYHAIAHAEARAARRACTEARVAVSRRLDVHYLAALLNSRLMDWYYQTSLGFGMHLYPDHVKRLPIVVAPAAQQRRIAALARQAADDRERRGAIEREMDACVEALYGLTDADRARVTR